MQSFKLEAFSDCLRRELLPFGIRVAVIQPGAIRSSAFKSQLNEFTQYKSRKPSEFHARAIAWIQAAFNRPPAKEKDPVLVVNDILHAINNKNNRLYYQPGRRLIPDIFVTNLPRKLVDWIFARMWTKPK